ncbi:MAG: YicC/YloC family endoribonuclease, partial [Desulfobacterales bacterium]
MVKSMTAYAAAEKTKDKINVLAEVRSYNSRHLDIALRMTHGYSTLEEKIKALVNNVVERGRIELSLQINDDADEAYQFEVNIPKAKAYYDCIVQLKDQLDLQADITIDLLIREGGVIRSAEIDRDMDAVWTVVKDCLDEALKSLVTMREKEGEMIAFDITDRINRIEQNVHEIEKKSGDLLSHYQERLKGRIGTLTRG